MKEIAELQKHIGTYTKTREIYAQYRKLLPKKAARFYVERNGELLACQAAKRYFDSLGMKKQPSIRTGQTARAPTGEKTIKISSSARYSRRRRRLKRNRCVSVRSCGDLGRQLSNKQCRYIPAHCLPKFLTQNSTLACW